jgi:hypothetical protein
MTTRTCDTCRWRQEIGECRRMPPVTVMQTDLNGRLMTLWPRVQLTDWCGEHAPKTAT